MYFSIRLKGTAEIYCTYILHICTSAVSCLSVSNGQFLHRHLEGQSFFTVPLLIVQHVHTRTHTKRLQGSLVPSPGFTKSSMSLLHKGKKLQKLSSDFPGSGR